MQTDDYSLSKAPSPPSTLVVDQHVMRHDPTVQGLVTHRGANAHYQRGVEQRLLRRNIVSSIEDPDLKEALIWHAVGLTVVCTILGCDTDKCRANPFVDFSNVGLVPWMVPEATTL